jgi:hypothetical protein
MQLQELKNQVIEEVGEMYGSEFFNDILGCSDVWKLIKTLNEYGYDTQGSLDILFSILID